MHVLRLCRRSTSHASEGRQAGSRGRGRQRAPQRGWRRHWHACSAGYSHSGALLLHGHRQCRGRGHNGCDGAWYVQGTGCRVVHVVVVGRGAHGVLHVVRRMHHLREGAGHEGDRHHMGAQRTLGHSHCAPVACGEAAIRDARCTGIASHSRSDRHARRSGGRGGCSLLLCPCRLMLRLRLQVLLPHHSIVRSSSLSSSSYTRPTGKLAGHRTTGCCCARRPRPRPRVHGCSDG